MATQRGNDRKSQRVKPQKTGVKSSNPSAQPDIPLKSLVPARYIIHGSISGRRYEWEGSGSVVSVDSRDAESLLAKRTPRACCGSDGQNVMFKIAE